MSNADTAHIEQPHSKSALAAFGLGVRLMGKHPAKTGSFLAFSLVQGVLQGAFVWVLREMLLTYSEADVVTVQLMLVSTIAVLGVWILRSGNIFLAQLFSVQLSERISVEMTYKVLHRLLRLSLRFFAKKSHGDLVMAAYQDLKAVKIIVRQVGMVIIHVAALIGLVGVAWMMSPKLTLLGVCVVPISILPVYHLGRRITEAATKERSSIANLHDVFLEVANAISMIKVNRFEDRMYARGEEVGEGMYRHVVRRVKGRELSRFLVEAIAGVGLVLILVLGGQDVARGTLAWQSLLGLLIAVMAIYSPVVGLQGVYTQLCAMTPNLKEVERIMNEPLGVGTQPGAIPMRRPPKCITLEDVSFSYDDQPVLKNISATFYQGETIGIVGHSGAGKSTLVALLLRFYDPNEGRIRLDDVDLREVRYDDFMDMCSIVLQEPFLFADTIANNIRVARPEAPMEAVSKAAEAANIAEEILEMEDAYDTFVGHGANGRDVSVGQKQRLNIATALLKNTPLLFLDEATSSLDSVSEIKVQQAIDRLVEGRTTFIIAHRFSTLRNVDRIVVLDQGRLVGLGTHEELMETCPAYQELWKHQHGAFLNGALSTR